MFANGFQAVTAYLVDHNVTLCMLPVVLWNSRNKKQWIGGLNFILHTFYLKIRIYNITVSEPVCC